MISGLCPALMLLKPRTRMAGVAPGSPLLSMICTPAASPFRLLITLFSCLCSIFFESTMAADPVKAERFCSPKAVTTISSRVELSLTSVTFISGLAMPEKVFMPT